MNLRTIATRATSGLVGKALLMATAVVLVNVLTVENVSGEGSAPERRYINGVYAPPPDPKRLAEILEAARPDSKYVDTISQSRDRFWDQKLDPSMKSAAEDAQMIDITDTGISIKAGRDQMRDSLDKAFTGRAYSSAGVWIPEKSGGETWGIYKNIKVTYQYATFRRDDGTEWTRPTIVVVDHKDGKRWREWRFLATDR